MNMLILNYSRKNVKHVFHSTYINHSRHLISDGIYVQGRKYREESDRIQRSPGTVVPSSFSNRLSGSLTCPMYSTDSRSWVVTSTVGLTICEILCSRVRPHRRSNLGPSVSKNCTLPLSYDGHRSS